MHIQNLQGISEKEIITCFLKAFLDYFVTLPADFEYWKKRFLAARVDWELSFGMFEEKHLVAFIIHGSDEHDGFLTAYNTGTGVLPSYRGKHMIDQLYKHAIPLLKKRGVEKALLEVITQNERAIKVYERIGFTITKEVNSFSGKLSSGTAYTLQKVEFQEVLHKNLYKEEHYSWDNTSGALYNSDDVETFLVLNEQDGGCGYFSLQKPGNLVQIESTSGKYAEILDAVGQVTQEVRLKNVPVQRTELLKELHRRDFQKTVSQFEMERRL